MSDRRMLVPDERHPITLSREGTRLVATAGGATIADSTDVVTLREASYPAVHYFPREHADLSLLERSDHRSWCPYKGEASYFHVAGAGERGHNAVWSYETPFDAVAAIRGHLAFYPDRVEISAGDA